MRGWFRVNHPSTPGRVDQQQYPTVEIVEEGMREGMQIESADITVDEKVALLNSLSRTGLRTIVVGSFVSPKWTPQMAAIEEVVSRFTPVEGVRYTALALNDQGRERMRRYMPPLCESSVVPQTLVHLCDVFVRRNTNRSQQSEIEGWNATIAQALADGVVSAGVGINAAWGSNWLGPFDETYRLEMLAHQIESWEAAGIEVDRVWIGDPMGWNMPDQVSSMVTALRARWPNITRIHLHLHDARGTALLSAYAALQALDVACTLVLDSSIGGMGGCPYAGHGRMTRMIATEDLVDFLEELGIRTGVDIDRIIESAALAEEVVGHTLWGHVSKAGPRPRGEKLFPMTLPFIETEEQAQHFRRGPEVYRDAPSPWRAPIESPLRSLIDSDSQRTISIGDVNSFGA